MKYVMIENTPGYLPDDDEPFFGTLEQCKEVLKDAVERLCEFHDENGEKYEVWWSEDLDEAYVSLNRPHDLGRSFSILPDES